MKTAGSIESGTKADDTTETAFTIDINGERMLCILHEAAQDAGVGVIIIVGGPQYRVGSHRQFVLLARYLAAAGYPVLRFDYRGLGDSEGEPRDFEAIEIDIRGAIDALCARIGTDRVVLWGLCDAASAAMMYAAEDTRVAGLVLLNPWVHAADTEARARLKSYYGARLRNPALWRKIMRLEIDWADSLSSLGGYLRRAWCSGSAFGSEAAGSRARDFVERMRCGWAARPLPTLLVLSGDDLTAAEFRERSRSDPRWQSLLARACVERIELADANHTFSRAIWRRTVEEATRRWLDKLEL